MSRSGFGMERRKTTQAEGPAHSIPGGGKKPAAHQGLKEGWRGCSQLSNGVESTSWAWTPTKGPVTKDPVISAQELGLDPESIGKPPSGFHRG